MGRDDLLKYGILVKQSQVLVDGIVTEFYPEIAKYGIYIVPFPFCTGRYLNDARILQGTKFSDNLTAGKVNNVKIAFGPQTLLVQIALHFCCILFLK